MPDGPSVAGMTAPTTESVWDYPRPPRAEAVDRRVVVRHGGVTVLDTRDVVRVLETSHPPTIYVPRTDVRADLLRENSGRQSFCEWKGLATHHDAVIDGHIYPRIAWSYAQPNATYAALLNHIAFYPGRVDEAWLDDELVTAQEGDFYGGWISAEIEGPFKGAPGTLGW